MSLALVGDIGGTHARFALWRDGRLEMPQVLETARFAGPEDLRPCPFSTLFS